MSQLEDPWGFSQLQNRDQRSEDTCVDVLLGFYSFLFCRGRYSFTLARISKSLRRISSCSCHKLVNTGALRSSSATPSCSLALTSSVLQVRGRKISLAAVKKR